MDFTPTAEQTMLRDSVRQMLGKFYDMTTFREVTGSSTGWSREVWKSLAAMGVLGLPFAEADGGMGAGIAEVSTVMGEVGRTLAPEPLLDAVFVPGTAINASGSANKSDLPAALSAGELLLAYAHPEPGDRWPDAQLGTTAVADGDAYLLSGTKNPVLHGDCADKFVVTAMIGDDIGLFLVDSEASGVSRIKYATHDRRRGAQVTFARATATRLGDGDQTDVLARCDVLAQTALCAEAVGLMERALELAAEYLTQRRQFGVPLARFQALTHRAADMYVLLELARSLSLYATMSLDRDQVSATNASRAKLQVCRSSRVIGQEAIQLHGGIGLTAEYPVAHVVNRLIAIEHTLGGANEHLQQLSKAVKSRAMLTLY
jgi:alkylation response protein AidB-like acyl-CoA dehydrogenase